MVAFSFAANAADPTVTIKVHYSDGSPITGAVASYIYSGSWTSFGTTDGSGITSKTIPAGTYPFTVTYRNTSKTQSVTVGTNDITIDFYTSNVSVNVSSCSGTNLNDVPIRYMATGTWNYLNHTDGSGNTSTEIFPGTYPFVATVRGTEQTQSITVGGDGIHSGGSTSVAYHPTAVTNYSGGYYYAMGTIFYTNGLVYMFPGTYPFHFGAYSTNITIANCTQNFFVNILILKDHNGNPLAGGSARGGYNDSYVQWFVDNSTPTDANGVVYDIRSTNAAPQYMSYEMKYNNTTAVLKQDVSKPNGNIFNFKTIELRLRLETCGGTGLSGGTGRWGGGTNFGTYFFPSPNSTDGNGETAAEWFPGTYSFEMNYQSTSNVKSSVTIPNANTILTWKTTNVTLSWPHEIAYGGIGDNTYFNKPSMELLPGTVNFNFRSPNGSNYIPLTISGCSMAPSVGNVRLINSSGGPISGGSVDGYQGGWSHYGTTDANGNLLVIGKNPSSLAMTYVGGREQKNGINFSVTPVVTFQTVKATMELKDHNGNYGLESDANGLSYYAGGWKVFGSGKTTNSKETMEMLPVSYSFALTYLGGRQQINNQNVGSNPVVTFQTTEVTMELKDHNGNYGLESDANGLSYYAGGWKVFGSGNTTNSKETMEMLPVSYSFALNYLGGRQQINNQNVGTNPVVTFQTKEVTMELKDHSGGYTLNADHLQYYAGGWKVFGSGNTTNSKETMEMLPVSYSFALSYLGGRQQINNQNVSGNNDHVTFQTDIAKMYLVNDCGSPIQGGSATYYAGGWHNLGTTDANGLATMELLPVSYSFRMAYSSKSNQQNGIAVPKTMYYVYDGSTVSYYGESAPSCNNSSVIGVNKLKEQVITEDQVITNEIRTFPNPVSDQLRITFGSTISKSSEIRLIDLSGRTVINQSISVQKGQNNIMMSVRNLTNGVYLLKIGNSKINKNKVVVLHE